MLKQKIKVLSLLLLALSIIIRLHFLPYTNFDMEIFNLKWYQTLVENGILNTLATNFTNYSPPYTYLLALATSTKDFIPPLIAIKLIPILFDIMGALVIFKITKIKYPQGDISLLSAAVFFAAPTIILNSSLWGQADSIYVFFLLLCLYYLMTNKPAFSMIAFGFAFAIKAQAVFLSPFLLIMFLQKRIPWKLAAASLLAFLLACLPVVFLGRSFTDTMFIYLKQASSYDFLSKNAPNLYLFFSNDFFDAVMPSGIIVAILATLYWVYLSSKAKRITGMDDTLLLALISTALVPFLLPKMHDRYFYPSDTLSILVAFIIPNLWFIALLYQLISTAAISPFLFGANPAIVAGASLVNTAAIAILLKTQIARGLTAQINSRASRIYSWLALLFIPVIVFGAGANILLSPVFMRIEYKLPYIPGVQNGLSNQTRVEKAASVIKYLKTEMNTEHLYRFNLSDNAPTLTKHEAYYLQDFKEYWMKINQTWYGTLISMYILGLLAWAGNSLPEFRQGARMGGRLTIGLGLLAALSAILAVFLDTNIPQFMPPADEIPMLYNLFPPRLMIDFLILLLVFMLAGGLVLAIGPRVENRT